MNTFAKIKLIAGYNKVVYYTVQIEGDAKSLFEDFLIRHTSKNKTKLNHILRWIQRIGNEKGAKEGYFRNEAETADTSALPPKGTGRKPVYIEDGENTANDLRLYCFRLNEYVVFLFNGDVKTAEKAQDCPQVRPHFRLANKLTKCIAEKLNNEIRWNEDYTDIVFREDLDLIF